MQRLLNTEERLFRLFSGGDRDATEQIYATAYPVVSKWIVRQGGLGSDAADIFQEAMIVLYEKAGTPGFSLHCRIGTYLFAVSRHLWLKKQEQGRRQPRMQDEGALDEHPYEDDIAVHAEKEAYYDQLDAALESLGEPCTSLLKAFYHQDKSMSEIALDFGYTNPENAKTQKYKCLTRLRKIFYGASPK